MGTVDAFTQIIRLVREFHEEMCRHDVDVVGGCPTCKAYLDILEAEPERLGLSEWPPGHFSNAREYMRSDQLEEIGVVVPVREVKWWASEKKIKASVRSGVWHSMDAIECAFSGGTIMSIEAAKCLRHALDLAIHDRGGT